MWDELTLPPKLVQWLIESTQLDKIKNLYVEVRSGFVVRTDPSQLTCPLSCPILADGLQLAGSRAGG